MRRSGLGHRWMDVFFFSSRRRHTRCSRDWSSDVCSSDLGGGPDALRVALGERALERAASLRELRRLGAQALALRLERGERAVGVGDRALGIAQRIARLALFAFPALQFLLQ